MGNIINSLSSLPPSLCFFNIYHQEPMRGDNGKSKEQQAIRGAYRQGQVARVTVVRYSSLASLSPLFFFFSLSLSLSLSPSLSLPSDHSFLPLPSPLSLSSSLPLS